MRCFLFGQRRAYDGEGDGDRLGRTVGVAVAAVNNYFLAWPGSVAVNKFCIWKAR